MYDERIYVNRSFFGLPIKASNSKLLNEFIRDQIMTPVAALVASVILRELSWKRRR